MQRAELLEKLDLVEPALSDNTLIPVLSHFWFTGTHLLAYNDQIAIETPCETEFVGAVPGTTLIAMLKTTTADDLVVSTDKNNLLIKAKRANLRFPLLDADQFIFKMPDAPNGDAMLPKVRDALVDAFEMCLVSVGNDTSVPDQLGVTIIPDNGRLMMFATNYATLTHVNVAVKGTVAKKVILSKQFVQQFIRLARDAKAVRLAINKDHSILAVERDDGTTMVFGRLIESENPIDFNHLLSDHLPKDYAKSATPIPNGLKAVLERAVIICDSKIDQKKTRITAADGRVVFDSQSDKGQVKDELKAGEHQPDVSIRVEAKLLRGVVDQFDDYLLHSSCAILLRDNALYLVAATSEAGMNRERRRPPEE